MCTVMYGGRLITAKNNQSETSANARSLERGVVAVAVMSEVLAQQ